MNGVKSVEPVIDAVKRDSTRLVADRVSKAYAGIPVLRSVSLHVEAGEILGIAGENGAGKSTTLKVLGGIVRPDSGTLTLDANPYAPQGYRASVRAGISMVFQDQALVQNLAVYENIFLAHESAFKSAFGRNNRKGAIDAASKALVDLDLEHISPTVLVGSLGFEDRQMIEIARAFALAALYRKESPIILLDEPSAAISEHGAESLFKRVNALRHRASFVLVTHRLHEYTEHCDRLYVLKDGENVAELMKPEMTEKRLHELMVGRKRAANYYKEERQGLRANNVLAQPILEIDGISGNGVVDVSFSLRCGEVLGIGGLLGCGKEAVGRAIAGAWPYPRHGSVRVAGQTLHDRDRARSSIAAGVAYVPRERKTEGVILYLPVRSNVSLVALPKMRVFGLPLVPVARENREVRARIERLRIKCASATQLCVHLSGGNQQKVVLAKWLLANPKVLVMDNPTRGIDVGVKEEIYSLIRDLADEGMAILIISDDLPELIGLSDRVLVMREGRVVKEYLAPPHAKPTEEQLVAHMV
ncbi:sugar ABC transporter ATP-binding protein [Paraburkholderia sp. RL17-383-BIF-A]|uniref:sugar ABC transporter ATP-binding protein n=1 Tax=Burkholderiaceae TaxID=119060 RepID=UPI0008951924|nr:sugar ABC transporter ATP-binding protein [Burkholderia sp. WP9]SEF05492.1 monosaccharide ABC transporter ATP-binding protein, CUT2 family [Burkholderia sp. WP9]